MTLKDMLLDIIHESTDGTGIAVRCDIDDVALCDAKCRFLCNTLKEGISNGLRHGGATAFYFELKRGRRTFPSSSPTTVRGWSSRRSKKASGSRACTAGRRASAAACGSKQNKTKGLKFICAFRSTAGAEEEV